MATFVNKFVVSMGDQVTRIMFSDQAAADGPAVEVAELVLATVDALDLAGVIQRLHQERAAQRATKQ